MSESRRVTGRSSRRRRGPPLLVTPGWRVGRPHTICRHAAAAVTEPTMLLSFGARSTVTVPRRRDAHRSGPGRARSGRARGRAGGPARPVPPREGAEHEQRRRAPPVLAPLTTRTHVDSHVVGMARHATSYLSVPRCRGVTVRVAPPTPIIGSGSDSLIRGNGQHLYRVVPVEPVVGAGRKRRGAHPPRTRARSRTSGPLRPA